jgi:hypothetical protein
MATMAIATHGHHIQITAQHIHQAVRIHHAQIMHQFHMQGLVGSVQTILIPAKVRDAIIKQKNSHQVTMTTITHGHLIQITV